MDFTRELSAFQGVIISADNVHTFSRLSTKGGNEEKILYIISKIQRFFEEENIVNCISDANAVQKMRKFAFYIVLNSDLTVLEEMVETEEFGLVIWSVPTIPKCLMCEMLWKLHMDMFMYEIIAFTYPTLALEVVGAIVDNFKYFTPTECPNKLSNLSTSCYTLICRLRHFNLSSEALTELLTTSYNMLQKLLHFFTSPPNEFKLNTLSRDELYKYQGRCLQAALLMLYNCVEMYQASHESYAINDLYVLTYKEESVSRESTNLNVVGQSNSAICECLNNCNILMLDKCKELVMDVSVDIFCAWSEFEENGRSMQQSIGEFCDKLRTKLLGVPSVAEHPIVSMIQQISRKPVDMKDIINSTDIDTIIENINKTDSDNGAWVHALIHKEDLCENIHLLKLIAANLDMYNEEECYHLYEIFKNRMNSNKVKVNVEIIGLLTVKVFQKCNISTRHQILEEHFGNSCFTDKLECSEFQNMLTQIFNKLIVAPDVDVSDVLVLFLQNPEQTYLKIFTMASENVQQLDIMSRVIKLLDKYNNHYYSTETQPCITKVTQTILKQQLDTESKQHNIVKFISYLKAESILPASKLLMLIIMPNIHQALMTRDVTSLFVQVKLLKEVYTLEELVEYRAPMLAMLAQVLNVVRWRINTFSILAPPILQLVLQLQQSLLATYNSVIPENEGKWLRTRLRKIQPSNMYYYRVLWNPPGENFLEIISGAKVTSSTDPSQITSWLSQIICSCTQQEWCDLWNSMLVFEDVTILRVLHNALLMITRVEEAHTSDATWACLLYCYRNLVFVMRFSMSPLGGAVQFLIQIFDRDASEYRLGKRWKTRNGVQLYFYLQYKFFKEPVTDHQVAATVDIVTATAALIKGQRAKEFSNLFLPLFAYLVEKKTDYKTDLSKVLKDKLRNTSFEDVVNKVFINGSN